MGKKILLSSLRNALATAAYVVIVSFIIINGDKIFGTMKTILGPIAFLLLFVVSAAITGFLVLGQPVMMYVENKKSEAIMLFIYTVAWLSAFTVIIFSLNLF